MQFLLAFEELADYSRCMSSSSSIQFSVSNSMQCLIEVMARLRDPVSGCPWDIKQTFETIAPYTIEEAYEVADAIQRSDMTELKNELGDLLLQVVYHARIAEEVNEFCFDDVASAIADKMIRRHPHVFNELPVSSADDQKDAWELQKARERVASKKKEAVGTLDGVAKALPALLRAYKLQKRAARVGFDWPAAEGALDKLKEELAELEVEMLVDTNSKDMHQLVDELGDVLFSVVNLARKLGIDPEAALRLGNEKFERRFEYIEDKLLAAGKNPINATLEEMEAYWDESKHKF